MRGSNFKTCKLSKIYISMIGQLYKSYENYSCTVYKCHVAKCHSMRVTRHLPENQIQFAYTLYQQKLEQVQSAKYLGIIITDNLGLGQHISEISSKATKTMGFLRCNLALSRRHTKEVAHKTLVRPQLEYAVPIWQASL